MFKELFEILNTIIIDAGRESFPETESRISSLEGKIINRKYRPFFSPFSFLFWSNCINNSKCLFPFRECRLNTYEFIRAKRKSLKKHQLKLKNVRLNKWFLSFFENFRQFMKVKAAMTEWDDVVDDDVSPWGWETIHSWKVSFLDGREGKLS